MFRSISMLEVVKWDGSSGLAHKKRPGQDGVSQSTTPYNPSCLARNTLMYIIYFCHFSIFLFIFGMHRRANLPACHFINPKLIFCCDLLLTYQPTTYWQIGLSWHVFYGPTRKGAGWPLCLPYSMLCSFSRLVIINGRKYNVM